MTDTFTTRDRMGPLERELRTPRGRIDTPAPTTGSPTTGSPTTGSPTFRRWAIIAVAAALIVVGIAAFLLVRGMDTSTSPCVVCPREAPASTANGLPAVEASVATESGVRPAIVNRSGNMIHATTRPPVVTAPASSSALPAGVL